MAELADQLRWRIDPSIFLFRQVCGKVVRTDPVTGIAYARARWYDARNAAWLSEDPLADTDSPNLYAFVGGPNWPLSLRVGSLVPGIALLLFGGFLFGVFS